jgi:hypothetical protein
MKERFAITGRIILLGLITSFVCTPVFGQDKGFSSKDFSDDVGFIQHFFKLEEYEEASIVLHDYLDLYQGAGQQDTLNFLLGKSHYYQKRVPSSIRFFENVRSFSPYFTESRFLSLYLKAYDGRYEDSRAGWSDFTDREGLEGAVVNFELAGVALLERDIESYDKYSSQFSRQYYQLATSQDNLEKFAEGIRSFKKKSPLLAGVFSAVVPGSGKMYYGKIGEGLISLLTQTIFGLQTLEAYRKDGIRSARFIIFGSAFSVFYIGNIWGSVIGVKIRNDEFNDQINESVLLTMHVPLRLLFD